MAFILAQGGTSLYKIDPTSGTATALTLPSGVTLSTTRKPKFAILNQFVVVTNSPSRNLAVDPEGIVRVLVPKPPASPPNVVAGSGTGYTGTIQYKVSYVVKGSDGQDYMESALSPASIALALTNGNASLSGIPISEDSVTTRRIYRNTTLGTQFYKLADLDDNTSTTFIDNISDASLATLPVIPTILKAPPGTLPGTWLKNITAWKNRLWGASSNALTVDTVYYTDDGKVYAWPYNLTAYPTGQDSEGIVAFVPRRDQLGLLKRDGLWQITGNSNANFAVIQIAFGKAGCIAPDSVVIVNDKAYWLSRDGVYQWDSSGVSKVSDLVDPWFISDTYFTRTRFQNAFARYNPFNNQYELHLAALGSSVEDRWVSLNLSTMKWYGPHKTDAFTPNSAALAYDTNGLPVSVVGASSGIVYRANSTTFTDGTATAIDMDVYTPFYTGDAPDIEHAWMELSMLSKIQPSGALTITPYVGRLDAAAGPVITHDMTKGRERLRRIGKGAMVQFRLRQAVAGQGASIYGFELPFFELGRR